MNLLKDERGLLWRSQGYILTIKILPKCSFLDILNILNTNYRTAYLDPVYEEQHFSIKNK